MFKKLVPSDDDIDGLPLPTKQFSRFMIVFHILAFGTWIGALSITLRKAWVSLSWREGVVIFLILLQVGIYLWLISSFRKKSFRIPIFFYFGASIAICLIEIWLIPELYWVFFMYMGQMFGLLQLRYAFPITLLLAVLIFFIQSDWKPANLTQQELFGTIGQIAAFVLLLVYSGHLNQTSKERGKLIGQLEEAKAKLESAQKQEAELAVLRERERLARDLHDNLGHALVALSVQLEAVQRLYLVDPQKASVQMNEMKILVRTSMEDLRRSLAGLRTPGLGDRKLRPALHQMCVEFSERSRIELSCQIDEKVDGLRPILLETLWRVAQEALTNVEKHAQARQVNLKLACEPQAVTLQVEDDGIGLPRDAENQPLHFGLRGMRERAEGLGGSLKLTRKEKNVSGTIIEVCLPIIDKKYQSAQSSAGEI